MQDYLELLKPKTSSTPANPENADIVQAIQELTAETRRVREECGKMRLTLFVINLILALWLAYPLLGSLIADQLKN